MIFTNDLEQAYLQTEYLVYINRKTLFPLRIQEHPPKEFLTFLERLAYHRFAYITPCNPCSVLLSKHDNKRRINEFTHYLLENNFNFTIGKTRSKNKEWNEISFCIFQIPLHEARNIAFTFSQIAFLYWSKDSEVKLHWTFNDNEEESKVEN